MNTASDAQLLVRIASRDGDAFAELYDRHCSKVLGFLVGILRDRSEAEDVLQVTFLQIWRQANRFEPARASARAWLYVLARSRALDALRKRKPVNMDPAGLDQSVSESTGKRLEQSDAKREVQSALSHLPPDQRGVLRLAFFTGLTHREIADRLSLPVGTVKTWIRRGMLMLRAHLDDPWEVTR